MKYNYLQQIENSASFLNTEIFRIYYSHIPKEVDMNVTSTHGSQFYLDNQPDTDNPNKTQEPAFIQKPLHLVESVNQNPQDNENCPNSSAENLNPEQVDTMLTSKPGSNRYFTDNQAVEKVVESNDVTAYDQEAGELVNLSRPKATDSQETSSDIFAASVSTTLDSNQPISETATLARSGEMQCAEEEPVATCPTSVEPTGIDNDKKAVEQEGVDDNQLSVKLDPLKETADITSPIEIVADQAEVKLDSLASMEEQRQAEPKVLSEDTFSLFHKLATPEKELLLTDQETDSSSAVEEPPPKESLDISAIKAGAYLRSEREKSRLSVQQVADKLYLDVNLIKTLEADNYEQLPPSIFVRGYIRNYAKLLGISAEPPLAAYEQSGQKKNSTPAITPQLAPKKQTSSNDLPFKLLTAIILIGLIVLGGLGGLGGLWQYYRTSTSESQEVTNVPDGPAWENFQPLETQPTYPPATVATNPASSNVPQSSDEISAVEVATTTPEEMAETPAETTEPTATTTASPAATSEEPQPKNLQIHFKQNVWVRVTDSKGKVFYNQTGKGGEVFSIQDGVPPFYLNVGNEGLQIEYQGKTTNISDYPRQKGKRNTFIIGGKE
jgi:cytoskeleton protein RodZ